MPKSGLMLYLFQNENCWINFLKKEDLQGWLKEFPDQAMRGRGMGDLSIIHDWQKICDQNPGRRVYIGLAE
jgi:hypothetical protein